MTSFRFLCWRDLISTLGKMDAIVEFAEVSTREILSQFDGQPDRRAFIRALADKHKIIVDHVDTNLISPRLSQLYLLSAFQQLENYLQRFRDEHPSSNAWTYTGIDANDLFKRVLSNLDENYLAASRIVGILECQIVDHYRLVRNRFLHSDVKESRVNSSASLVLGKCDTSDYKRLNAPSQFDEINFDDYILFTRAIKQIAKAMCQLGRPTDEQILKMFVEKLQPNEIKNINKIANNPKRLKNKFISKLKMEYSLNSLESGPIADMMINDLDRLLA